MDSLKQGEKKVEHFISGKRENATFKNGPANSTGYGNHAASGTKRAVVG